MRIIVSGSLAYDRIMTFPGKFSDHILPEKLHILNVCFTVTGMEERFGGTAGNIAYCLALLGESPVIVATAGRDFQLYEEWLVRHKLPLEGIVRIDEVMTASAYITTDQSDNQITGFNPGAMGFPTDYALDRDAPDDTLVIVSPGNPQDMTTYSRMCKERSIPYIFDPGQTITSLSKEQLTEMSTGSRLLISNDYELEMIVRATGLDKAALLERTSAIITTLGEKGAIVSTGDGDVEIPPSPVRAAVDPTGAGDAFRAGLLKGLISGKSLVESARLGSVAGAFAVECSGTQCHSFTMEEFRLRYEKDFGG